MFWAKCRLVMKNRVQFNIIKSKKWYFWRKSESMGLFSPALIFQETALWTVYFWGSKGQCSATASSKNIQKVNLGPPKCLESLVINQFWWIRYPLFWTFFEFLALCVYCEITAPVIWTHMIDFSFSAVAILQLTSSISFWKLSEISLLVWCFE